MLFHQFFTQRTADVAQSLLGKVLVHCTNHTTISGIIVETEAYIGPHDMACHASKGKTERTSVMFGEAGVWYVYLIYGFYHCLNIVTEARDYPSAVLIRALEPLEGIETMQQLRKTDKLTNLTSGPGKLCQALAIDRSLNCTSAITSDSALYIEDRGITIPHKKIARAKRVGVDYAGRWKDRLLRFYVKDNTYVSKAG